MKTKVLHINKSFTTLLLATIILLISCGDSNRITQPTPLPTPTVVYTPGDLVSDGPGYIQYRVGNTPVIITVPHDGTLVPSALADRMGDTDRAINTRKVAEQFAVFFNANSNGLFPHIIYNNLSRTKLDPDANLMDGAQGNSNAINHYGTYHRYLQTAIDSVEANFDAGILLNLVEHNNAAQQFEIGYLLSESDLNLTDAELNNGYSTLSSIGHLSSISAASFAETLRGYNSFGEYLITASYNGSSYQVVPTLDNPNAPSDGYTSGGYTLTAYGKERWGKMSAIEVATPYSGFRDNANAYRAVGVVLEDATYKFYQAQIGISIY